MSKLNAYSIRKSKKDTNQPNDIFNLDDIKLTEELKKIAVSPQTAKMWATDPCARPC